MDVGRERLDILINSNYSGACGGYNRKLRVTSYCLFSHPDVRKTRSGAGSRAPTVAGCALNGEKSVLIENSTRGHVGLANMLVAPQIDQSSVASMKLTNRRQHSRRMPLD